MKKIKEKLIHLLGGVTVEEHKKWLQYFHLKGRRYAYEEICKMMELQYGKPADEWCKIMYDNVEETCKRLENEYIFFWE